MMKLNHINLPVHDVGSARDFLSRYFDLITTFEIGKNFLVMMQDQSGFVLNLSQFDKSVTTEVQYHSDFHIGFFLESAAEVEAVHAKFVADAVDAELPKSREGRYGFYVKAPGGFIVEVSYLTL